MCKFKEPHDVFINATKEELRGFLDYQELRCHLLQKTTGDVNIKGGQYKRRRIENFSQRLRAKIKDRISKMFLLILWY